MKKAKSQSSGSAAKKNSPKKEVGGRLSETPKDVGLQPLAPQNRSKPRPTTVPRDEATTVPRDAD